MEFLILGVMLVAAMITLVVAGTYCEKYYLFVESYNPSIANIDFKSFHSWYLLNPERYILCENYVKVKKSSFYYDYELMGFKTFKDWCKYRNFMNNKKVQSDNALSTESMVKILNLVQSDIDATRVKISNERNMVINNLNRIIKV